MDSTILPPISSALPGVLARSAKVARFKIIDGVAVTLRTSRFNPYFNSPILTQIVHFLQEKSKRRQDPENGLSRKNAAIGGCGASG